MAELNYGLLRLPDDDEISLKNILEAIKLYFAFDDDVAAKCHAELRISLKAKLFLLLMDK